MPNLTPPAPLSTNGEGGGEKSWISRGRSAWHYLVHYLVCLITLVAACGNGPPEPDTQPPRLVSTQPADGATGVARTTQVVIIFDEAIDNHTLDAGVFHLEIAGSPRYGNVSYDLDAFRATLTMPGGLQAQTDYLGVLEPGVRDLAGNGMSGRTTWTFTTAP